MRRAILTVFACLCLCVCEVAAAHAAEQLADGIAAQVGPDIVLVSEIMQMVGPTETKMREAGAPEIEIAKLRAEGLEQLIETRLIEQVVRQSELQASDEEIDEAIEGIASENGLTLEQLKQSVTAHELRFSEYRQQIKQEIERRKVVQAMIGSRIRIEEAQVRALYDERFSAQPAGGEMVHVRQLLITFGEEVSRTPQQACGSVLSGQVRIRAGEPFQNVARELSVVAPEKGGDIGWLHVDKLAPWMSNVVGALQDGEVSELIELSFGCSLLQLVERREYTPITYEQAKELLTNEVHERNLAAEYRTWMEELREKTFIERKGYFAEAARLRPSRIGRGESEFEESGEPIDP